MFEFETHQMITCAAHNDQKLDEVIELFENDIYALDPEYNEVMHEISVLLKKLSTSTLKHKYDAEISQLTRLRNQL